MGNSTIQLQDVVDLVATQADIAPQANPSGYAAKTILTIASDTMADLIAQDFNWKWNSLNIKPFYTNGYQQDYPQLGVKNIGWFENAFWVNINDTSTPKANNQMIANSDLPVLNYFGDVPRRVAWYYNKQLQYETWPGPNTVFQPLVTTQPGPANKPATLVDSNGNLYILTTFGTTGNTQPAALPVNSLEGATVNDGTCVWTVVDPDGQGYRIWPNPPNNGPVFQINVSAQKKAIRFTAFDQTLDPIPDDYSQYFNIGFNAHCYRWAADRDVKARFPAMRAEWLSSMPRAAAQANRELESYGMYPATLPVADPFGRGRRRRNPQDPARPY